MNDLKQETSSNLKTAAYLTGFLAFVLLVYILVLLKPILVPLTIAAFLTFLFHPLVTFLRKMKVPKWISIIIILSVVVFLNYILLNFLYSSFEGFGEKIQAYAINLNTHIRSILKPFNMTEEDISRILGIDITLLNGENFVQSVFQRDTFLSTVNFVTSFIIEMIITFLFWIFMILGKERFERKLTIAFEETAHKVSSSIMAIDEQLQSYLLLKTIISLCVAVSTTVILLLFGTDFALLWGILAFFLNFIPHIGPMAATIAPIITALLQYGFNIKMITLSLLLVLIHNIFGNFLEPHLLGKQLDLSPVFVLFSLVFWGLVWGVPGMFLAVPIAASIKIIFSNVEPLKPIAFIMGSKSSAWA